MPPQNSAKTIAATAAVTLVIAGVACLIFQKIKKWKQKNKINSSFRRQETTVTHEEFDKFKGRVKGLIVDEDGKEVLYTRNLECGELKATCPKIVLNPSFEEDEDDAEDEEKSIGISRKRSARPRLFLKEPHDLSGGQIKAAPIRRDSTQSPPVSARLLTQPPPSPTIPAAAATLPHPPPPPPLPPLHHPPQATLPPIRAKRNPMPAPSPPKALNLASPLKPPPAPKENANNNREGAPADENSNRTFVGRVKLKPLHWDKVATNVDHSMVWNEIKDGTLR